MPSITRTRQSATPKSCHTSFTAPKRNNRVAGKPATRPSNAQTDSFLCVGQRQRLWRLQPTVVQIFEEFTVRLDQEHIALIREGSLIRRHASVKSVEFLVLGEGCGINLCCLSIPLSTNFLSGTVGFRTRTSRCLSASARIPTANSCPFARCSRASISRSVFIRLERASFRKILP